MKDMTFVVYKYNELEGPTQIRVKREYSNSSLRLERCVSVIEQELRSLFPKSNLSVQLNTKGTPGNTDINVWGDLDFEDLLALREFNPYDELGVRDKHILQSYGINWLHHLGHSFNFADMKVLHKICKVVNIYLPYNGRDCSCNVDEMSFLDRAWEYAEKAEDKQCLYNRDTFYLLLTLQNTIISMFKTFCQRWGAYANNILWSDVTDEEIRDVEALNHLVFFRDGTWVSKEWAKAEN